MNTFTVIARREMKLALSNRSVLITAFIFSIWFPVMSTLGIAASVEGDAMTVTAGVAAITLPVAVFLGYIFCADAFLREKRDGTIETLLCTPVSLQRLWEGKVAGITAPAYGILLLSIAVSVAVISNFIGVSIIAEPLLLVHLIFVVPVWIAAAAGLIGAAQLALGMRENQILGFVFIFGFFFIIFTLQGITPGGSGLSVATESVFAAAGLLLLALARFIAGKVTRERIVRTIS